MDVKAIQAPSGDQRGLLSLGPEVNGWGAVAPAPVAATQIDVSYCSFCRLTETRTKATRDPSGAICGSEIHTNENRSVSVTGRSVAARGTGPIVGPYLADFLRAGPEFGATTLSRFYAIHMLLVPAAIAALIGAHLYLVAKLGTTAPPWLKAEEPEVLRKVEA